MTLHAFESVSKRRSCNISFPNYSFKCPSLMALQWEVNSLALAGLPSVVFIGSSTIFSVQKQPFLSSWSYYFFRKCKIHRHLKAIHSSSLTVPVTEPGNGKGKSVSWNYGSQVRWMNYSEKKDFHLSRKKYNYSEADKWGMFVNNDPVFKAKCR